MKLTPAFLSFEYTYELNTTILGNSSWQKEYSVKTLRFHYSAQFSRHYVLSIIISFTLYTHAERRYDKDSEKEINTILILTKNHIKLPTISQFSYQPSL